MIKEFNRRDTMKMGFGLTMMGGATLAMPAMAQSGGHLTGTIWCHTMGSASDIALFKETTGIDANITCWSSNTDTLTKLASGLGRTSDVMNLGSQFVPVAMQRDLLAPLDISKIPNASLLASQFKAPAHSMKGGKQYSLPFVFGYDSLVYNKKKLGVVDSYGVLFDEKNKGLISIRDDPAFSIPQAALFLGYPNPWRLSGKDLNEVTKFLISKKPIFRTLWGGFAEAVSLLKSEEVLAVGDGWISMAWTLNDAGKNSDFAIAKPKEKALIWTHDWLMPKEVPERKQEDAVYAFMNWSIGAEQAANMGRKVGYISTSTAGLKLLSKDEAKLIGYDDFQTIFQNGMPMNEFPENYQEWVEAWNRFKAA